MEENDEKKEGQENAGIINKARDGARKANKTKFKIKAFLKSVMVAPIIIKVLLIIALVVSVVGAVSKLLNLFGDNSISYVASKEIMTKDVKIAKASDEEGYYFKISKDIVQDYIKQLDKAMKQGYYLSRDVEEKDNNGGVSEGTDIRYSAIKSDAIFQKKILRSVLNNIIHQKTFIIE